jgi:autotransporter-associated beta strand protein
MKPKSRRALALFAVALLPSSLEAASITWNNTGTDFNAGASWTGGIAPGTADIAIFTGTGVTNPALSAAASVKGLAYSNATTSGYTISANTLTLGTGGIDASAVTSGTNTISSNLTLASGGQTWKVGTGSTLTISPTSLTRSVGTAVRIDKSTVTGTVSTSTLAVTNGILGTWTQILSTGAAANNSANGATYATVTSGNIAPYTAATSQTLATAWGGIASGGTGTVNYDISSAGTLGATGLGRNINTIRYTGTGARQPGNNAGDLLTINGLMNSGTGAFTLGRNGANITNDFSFGVVVGTTAELVLAPVSGDITFYSFIKNNGATPGNVTVNGNNKVELAGVNTYTGATTIAGGTLHLSGAGSINSTSGISINGSNAKYLHTSSVASTRTITLDQGTLDGTGTVGTVTVADTSSAVIANGNGSSTALTIGSLTFNGDSTVNLNATAGAGVKVTGALATTPANGQVVLNVSNPLPNGISNLIEFGTFTGSVTDFTANFPGLGGRQSVGGLQLNGSNIAVNIVGENIVWSGAGAGTWQTATTGDETGPNDWAKKTLNTATNFWSGDTVEFNDTYNVGAGNVAVTQTAVTIADAVAPAATSFNNSAVDYVLSGSGIAAGTLSKNGTGTVTLTNANTYTGATTVNQGTLQIGDGTTDGSLAAASAITNNATLVYNTVGNQTAANAISGTGALVKKGFSTLTLTGANSYSGGTTIDEGALTANVNGLNGGPITLGANGTLTFTGNGQTSTSTLTGSGTIINNTANTIVITGDHTGFNGSFTHSAAANNTQFNSSVSASQNASYNISAGEIIFAASGDYTIQFGSLASSGGTIRGGNAATGTTTVEVGNLGADTTITGNFNNGATKVLALHKVGSGMLTFDGGVNYTGATTVDAGTLAFGTTVKTLGGSAFTVADSAGLSVKAASPTTTMLPTASLTLGNSTLAFDFSNFNPTVPQITTGDLTLNGSLTINFANTVALGTGSYKLIDYNSLSGSGTLPAGSFSVGPRSTATIVENTLDTSIDLNVTADTPKWTGLDSGEWLAGSTGSNKNWKLGVSNTATDYLNDDQVLFDDSATGTRDVVINSSDVLPASTTFDTAASNYTLSGPFGIAAGNLVKSGTGSVTISNTNTYSGTTTINGGTLVLGNGVSDGSIANTLSVANNGTLAFNLLANQTAAYPITGTGSLTKTGTGILTLSGANTYSGGTSLNSGTIDLIANGSLGTGTIALASGTTLSVNKALAVANVVTGSGAIVSTNTFTNTGDFSGFSGSFTHNTAFASVAFNTANSTSQNASYHIASDQGSVQGMIAGGNGDYTLQIGSLSGVANSLFRGGFTATGTTTLEIGNLGTDTEFAGSITNGTNKFIGLTKVGTGTLTLSGASTYTAATSVNAGTLNVTGSLAAGSAVTVNVAGTLKGTGTVAGTITGSGTIAPGTSAGTLTTGPVTLSGTLAVEIDGATGDKLLSTGAIDLSAMTLTVTLLSGGFTEPSYVIAEGTSITGNFASIPSGYAVNVITGGTGQQAVLTSTTGGYSSWASTNANGQTADLDFDKDGVSNGIEYFMNAAAGFTANPSIVSGAITWPNGGNIPASAYGTQFKVQTSSNLSTWTDVAEGNLTTNTNSTLTYTLPTGAGKIFARLVVTPN